MKVRISHPKDEGFLQASKWLTFRVLLGLEELSCLIEALPPFLIYNASKLTKLSETFIEMRAFKERYSEYLNALERGSFKQAPPCFSSIWTTRPSSVYAFEVKKDRFIIKPTLPPVQVSHHQFSFSHDNQTFHSMLHSHEATPWGLQFSYPQIFSNTLGGEVVEVLKNQEMPNNRFFMALSKWMRKETRPTPFLFEDNRLNATFRIGKQSLHWAEKYLNLEPLRIKI